MQYKIVEKDDYFYSSEENLENSKIYFRLQEKQNHIKLNRKNCIKLLYKFGGLDKALV